MKFPHEFVEELALGILYRVVDAEMYNSIKPIIVLSRNLISVVLKVKSK